MYTTCTHITGHTDHRHIEHEHNISSIILSLSLAKQGRDLLVRKYICTYILLYNVDPPSAGLRHSGCPVAVPGSQSPWFLAPGHASPWGCSPSPFAVTDHFTHMHRHPELTGTPLVSSSWDPQALTLTDTHASRSRPLRPYGLSSSCWHCPWSSKVIPASGLTLGDTPSLPPTRPCHLLTGLSGWIFTSDHMQIPTITITSGAAPWTHGSLGPLYCTAKVVTDFSRINPWTFKILSGYMLQVKLLKASSW